MRVKFLLILLCFGCKSSNYRLDYEILQIDNYDFIIERKFVNNNLLTERLLNSDSIPVGFHREYEDGKPSLVGSFKNGQKDSTWLYFDLAGDTIKVENWFSGKKFGRQIEFYNKPRQLLENSPVYTRTFINIDGEMIFKSQFDLDGNLKYINGAPLYYVYNSDKLRSTESLELVLFFDCLPNYNCELNIEEYNHEGNQVGFRKISKDSLGVRSLPFAYKILHEKKFLTVGKYKLVITMLIKDSVGALLSQSKSDLSISVK